MKRSLTFGLLIAFLCMALCWLPLNAQQRQKQQISGRILDLSGKPISGVVVHIHGYGKGRPQVTSTQGDGVFFIDTSSYDSFRLTYGIRGTELHDLRWFKDSQELSLVIGLPTDNQMHASLLHYQTLSSWEQLVIESRLYGSEDELFTFAQSLKFSSTDMQQLRESRSVLGEVADGPNLVDLKVTLVSAALKIE